MRKRAPKRETKEVEHGARVIADRILTRVPMLFISKAGQNCGAAQLHLASLKSQKATLFLASK
jgi:hypothetical protein